MGLFSWLKRKKAPEGMPMTPPPAMHAPAPPPERLPPPEPMPPMDEMEPAKKTTRPKKKAPAKKGKKKK